MIIFLFLLLQPGLMQLFQHYLIWFCPFALPCVSSTCCWAGPQHFSVQKGLERHSCQGRGLRAVQRGGFTLHTPAPAHRNSLLDLGLGISEAKAVRHRISKWMLPSVCVSCGLISPTTQGKESFMGLRAMGGFGLPAQCWELCSRAFWLPLITALKKLLCWSPLPCVFSC